MQVRQLKNKLTTGRGRYIILGISVVAVGLLATAGWFGYERLQENSTPARKAAAKASCTYADKDLCKFFAVIGTIKQYKLDMKQETTFGDLSSIIEVDGKNTRTIATGEDYYETIITPEAGYTRTAKSGAWYKEPISADVQAMQKEAEEAPISAAWGLKEPGTKASEVTYTKKGTAACGDLTCFVYGYKQASENKAVSTFMFDTEEYKLRKVTMGVSDNEGTHTATISYGNVSVRAPKDFKTLKDGEVLSPETGEPIPEGSFRSTPEGESGGELDEFVDTLEGRDGPPADPSVQN